MTVMDQGATTAITTRDNDTIVECPRCGFQKIINIAKFFQRSNVGNFVSECKCGYSLSVVVERRKFERHYFDTKGSVLHEGKKGKPESSTITVKDLSRSGAKFVTEKNEALEAGEDIVVTFEFNDDRKTYFIKEARVRNVDGKNVRAEFKTLCGDIAVLIQSVP